MALVCPSIAASCSICRIRPAPGFFWCRWLSTRTVGAATSVPTFLCEICLALEWVSRALCGLVFDAICNYLKNCNHRPEATKMSLTKEAVIERLKTVNGPDFSGNIVDLGLVSDIIIIAHGNPGSSGSPRLPRGPTRRSCNCAPSASAWSRRSPAWPMPWSR